MNMQPKHLAVIGAMLVAIGTQIGGMEHGWHDALTPQWLSGLLIQIGTTLAALFVGPPRSTESKTRADDPPKP